MSDDFNVVVRAMAERYKELKADNARLRVEVERLSVLASVTTSEALAGVTLPPDVGARLLAEQERDEARADLALMTQERDAISSVFDAYKGDCDALRAALVEAGEVIHDDWCSGSYHAAPCRAVAAALAGDSDA